MSLPSENAVSVRERPPLRLSVGIETPSGRRYRWAGDEIPERAPSGLSMSSTMPGGFENFGCVLPRDPARDSADLEELSTVTVYGAGGDVRGEYRLERSPRTSGDHVSVSPAAVGWQAHLGDNSSVQIAYVDADLSAWSDISTTRRLHLDTAGYLLGSTSVGTDAANLLPAVVAQVPDPSTKGAAETMYDAGPAIGIGKVYYDFLPGANVDGVGDANWLWEIDGHGADDFSGATNITGDLSGVAAAGYATFAAAHRYALLGFYYLGTLTAGIERDLYWRKLTVYADHGLPLYGADPGGLLASDIEAHALAKWAPRLNFTTGAKGSILPSSFVIPHLVFKSPTTAAEVVKQATRFELRDWAVWENRTYYSNDRGARGHNWRARVGPSQLEETGPQVDRIWNAIMVSYRDVDGSTRTAGPPGAGADTEDSALTDPDPLNPATRAGITRMDLLQMGTSTAAGAVATGARFLEWAKLLNTSGRAQLVGWVEDDRGVVHAASKVRAGDTVTFIDAADPSPRRIVRAEYNDASKACAVDLDSPPEGLQQLLERLNVVLVPLGV